MWMSTGAIGALPPHAEVDDATVAHVLKGITRTDALRVELDAAFRRLELRQPALAELFAYELAELERPEEQALGYFLMLVVYLSFEHAFGNRLLTVSGQSLEAALDRLVADSEVRQTCTRDSYSEDLIAAVQPALMRMIQHELLQEREGDPVVSKATRTTLMQTLLLELIALSEAVAETLPRGA
jgi:hypothetical protein